MDGIRISDAEGRYLIGDGDAVLAEYVVEPTDPVLESPRPYLSPIRTRGGEIVSLFRPHDHVWHKGIAWSLPVVGDENFWGGPTFVTGEGYVQRPNNGRQQLRTASAGPRKERGEVHQTLDWITEAGETILEEERIIHAALLSDEAWTLRFETRMRNVTARPIPIGSPTTRGRENAGYGGLFWRGPRSFTGGAVLAPGRIGGDELRGERAPWMGFSGRHDGHDASSTVVIIDDAANIQHPPQWFARSEDFACLCPAPFFSEEHPIGPGEVLALGYTVVIADGGSDPERAARLVAEAAALWARPAGAAARLAGAVDEERNSGS